MVDDSFTTFSSSRSGLFPADKSYTVVVDKVGEYTTGNLFVDGKLVCRNVPILINHKGDDNNM